jgi:hypothetical protein
MFRRRHYKFQKITEVKDLKEIEDIQNAEVTIMKIQLGWVKLFLEFVFSIKLEDMSLQNVHRLIAK